MLGTADLSRPHGDRRTQRGRARWRRCSAPRSTATRFELVYFGPRGTADALGSYFLVWGLFAGRPGATGPGVFAAGFAVAMALGVRMQIAPVIA